MGDFLGGFKAARRYVGAVKIGCVVGAGEPPAGSRVTATTALRGTVPRRRRRVLPPPAKRPAGLGALFAGITQAS
jgi:hypothetical protein